MRRIAKTRSGQDIVLLDDGSIRVTYKAPDVNTTATFTTKVTGVAIGSARILKTVEDLKEAGIIDDVNEALIREAQNA